jgi:colicin import membrane protein
MNWTANRDEPGKLASGVLAVVVHIAFFALLVLGVSWQHRTPDAVEVELWNNLPPVPQVKPPPPPQPQIEPKPEVKPPPPPPPQPKVEAKPKPEPEPKPVAKPDIALEKEKQEKARREREAREKLETIKREQQSKADAKKREDATKDKLAALERQRREQEDRIARLQKEEDEAIKRAQQAQASAQSKMVDEYKRRISDKIRRYVVKDPCASLGNPEIIFEAILLPDGNTLQPPRIKRSSGSAACDDAVLRAVIRAQPLPLPPDPVLVAQFRELSLNFRPNE